MAKNTNAKKEMVTVRIAFTTRVRFDEEVRMTRSLFNRMNAQVEDDDVDLTEWIDWGNPVDVGESEVDEFEVITDEEA